MIRFAIARAAVFAVVLLVASVSGCEVGPNYHRPSSRLIGSYTPSTQRAADVTRYWEVFKDPTLDSLVDRAAESNLDLQLAEARVRQSRALRDYANGGFFPTVDADASYSREKVSGAEFGTGATGTAGGAGLGGSAVAIPSRFDFFQAGFDASYELDVFGGVRRNAEAAQADLEAQLDNRRSVLMTLVSEVAVDYMTLRGAQRQLEIAQENISTQQQTVALTKSRFNAGIASDLDVAQAQAQLETTVATLPTYQTVVQQEIHALSVLLGESPLALESELTTPAPIPPPPPLVPDGLPSDLLRRRPDVRQAERNMAAASARVGVAVADLFPRFSLTGSFGYESIALKKWFTPANQFWNFGPTMSWDIFDGGQVRANIRAANSVEQQNMIMYRQSVLSAMQDVEDALVGYNRELVREQALRKAVEYNQRALNLAQQLYAKGLVDFLYLLDTQATLFAAESSLVQSEQNVTTDLVSLYKALGGGWEPFDQPATTRPEKVGNLLTPNVVP
jgi:NodT family efflux transporter outer membrane factor (OMF) lipoprotein